MPREGVMGYLDWVSEAQKRFGIGEQCDSDNDWTAIW